MSDTDKINEFKRNKLNIKCKEHQTLNKYYLKKSKKFICEYDGFDEDGPDSFVHLPQILEENREKILSLQNKEEKQKQDFILEILPEINKEYNSVEINSEEINTIIKNFDQNFLSRIQNMILKNESFSEIREVINQIKFNGDGKPDLRKIGMDA